MLGNMGYSSVQCTSVPLDLGKINIQCPYGKVGEIYEYGINASDATAENCLANDDIAKCKPDSTSFIDTSFKASLDKSMNVIDYGKWENLYTVSAGKEGCMVKGESRLFMQFSCVQSKENQAMKYD